MEREARSSVVASGSTTSTGVSVEALSGIAKTVLCLSKSRPKFIAHRIILKLCLLMVFKLIFTFLIFSEYVHSISPKKVKLIGKLFRKTGQGDDVTLELFLNHVPIDLNCNLHDCTRI